MIDDAMEALDFVFCRAAFNGCSPDHPPKLVLLDLKLPKVNGSQVLREIKASLEVHAIPAVVLTSSSKQQKPADIGQFPQTIKMPGLYWLVVSQPPPDRAFTGGHDRDA